MKKIIISLLFVLLTICLFVGCSSSPKDEQEELPESVSFGHNDVEGWTIYTFKDDGESLIFSYIDGREDSSESSTYCIDSNGLCADIGGNPVAFYKDDQLSPITTLEELFSLQKIYDLDFEYVRYQ